MPDTLSREDRNAAVGLLETLRTNAGYTDGTERNVNAIVGFMVGVRLAHTDALTAAVEAVSDGVGNMELSVSKLPHAPQYVTDALELLKARDDAVLAILRGEQ